MDRDPYVWNFRIDPTFELWSLKLNFKSFISSYDVDYRQAFNRFKLNIPSLLMPTLQLDLPWLNLHFIDANPNYSDFVLSGTNVRGGAIDLRPGWFVFSVSGGKLQRGITGSDSTEVAYSRFMYGIKIGVGKKENSHIHLNYVHAWDDSSSIPSYIGVVIDQDCEEDTIELAAPIENSVASLESKLTMFKRKLKLNTEFALSAYTRDIRSNPVSVEEANWFPKFLFQPRMTSQLDYAVKTGASLDLNSTQVNFTFQQIGWGFEAVTVNYLDQDTRTWELSFDQTFSGAVPMFLSISGELCRDNLDGMKSVTTKTQMGTFSFGMYPVKFPTLNIGYCLFFMSAPADSIMGVERLEEITHSLWGSSSYNFKINEQNQNIGVNFSGNLTENTVENEESYTWNLNINGTHGISGVFTAIWNMGISENNDDSCGSYLNGGLGVDVGLWKGKSRNSLYGSYQLESQTEENKVSLKLTNSLELFKNFDLEISNKYIVYDSEVEENYTEYVAIAGVSYKW